MGIELRVSVPPACRPRRPVLERCGNGCLRGRLARGPRSPRPPAATRRDGRTLGTNSRGSLESVANLSRSGLGGTGRISRESPRILQTLRSDGSSPAALCRVGYYWSSRPASCWRPQDTGPTIALGEVLIYGLLAGANDLPFPRLTEGL